MNSWLPKQCTTAIGTSSRNKWPYLSNPHCHQFSIVPWLLPKKGELQAGRQHILSLSLALPSINLHFAMHSLWGIVGSLSLCPLLARFTLDHVLSCAKGGFPSIRHNDVTVTLLSKVCHEVATDPHLQPLNGEVLLVSLYNTGSQLHAVCIAMSFHLLSKGWRTSSSPSKWTTTVTLLLFLV